MELEQAAFIIWKDRVAERIARLGLTAPAVALLELHKPLVGVFHASALIAQPTIWAFFGRTRSEFIVALFEKVTEVEDLIKRIENAAEQKQLARMLSLKEQSDARS